MDILHLILNNGYNPYLIHGYGGLGYVPPDIKGDGLFGNLVEYNKADKVSEIKLPNEETGEDEIYPIPEQPTSFLWDVILHEDSNNYDKSVLFTNLQERQRKQEQKYNLEFNNYIKHFPKEEQERLREINDRVNDLRYYKSPAYKVLFPKIKKSAQKIQEDLENIKKPPKEEEEEEEEEVGEEEEEEDLSDNEINPVDEYELQLNQEAVTSIQKLEKEIETYKKIAKDLTKEYEKAIILKNTTDALVIRDLRDENAREIDTRQRMIELYKNPDIYVQHKTVYELTPEEKETLNNTELDIDEFPEEIVEDYGKTIEDLNNTDELMKPLAQTPELKNCIVLPTKMKETILKSTGEGAGKSLETHISTPLARINKPTHEEKELGEQITGYEGSIIASLDEILLKKKYSGASNFCYDNIDTVNNCIVECKKYDAYYTFEELYNKFVDEYNAYYLKFREKIDTLKTYIIETDEKIDNLNDNYNKLEKSKTIFNTIISKYNNNENVANYLTKFNVKNIKELKQQIKNIDNDLTNITNEREEVFNDLEFAKENLKYNLESVTLDGEFNEDLFKRKFYKEYDYTGITLGINKFPKPTKWAGLDSANNERCFNEIKNNRKTAYDIDVIKEGKYKGHINNIKYVPRGEKISVTTALDASNKNKTLQEVFDFKENNYELIFLIACDDALLVFDYTKLINDLPEYEDITNLFRGVLTKYDKEGIKYDSVVIPMDCFKAVNLKDVYGDKITLKSEAQAVKEASAKAKAQKEAEKEAKAIARAEAKAKKEAETQAKAQARAEAKAKKEAELKAKADAKALIEAQKVAKSKTTMKIKKK